MDIFHYRQLLADLGQKETLENVMRDTLRALGAEEGSLLVPVDSAELEVLITYTPSGRIEQQDKQRFSLFEGYIGMAAQSGETQVYNPVYQESSEPPDQGLGRKPISMIATPLTYDDDFLGVMTLINYDEGEYFTAEQAAHYEAVADLLGILLHQQAVIDELVGKQDFDDSKTEEAEVFALLKEIFTKSPERLGAVINVLKAIKELV